MALSGTEPQTYVFTDISYNLNNWFSRNLNTISTIYINGVALTQAESENYTFSGNEGDLVDVTLQDDIDSTCRLTKTFTLDGCSLNYIPSTTEESIAVSLNIGDGTRTYFRVRNCFSGTNQNTIYKLLIRYTDPNDENNILSYGPVNIVKQDQYGNPLVEARHDFLADTYYNDHAPSDPQFPTTNSQLIVDVSFTARNTFLCTAGTANFEEYLGNITVAPSVQISYDATDPFYDNGACGLTPNRTIYCDQQTVTLILTNGAPIYDDQFRETYAPAGYYSNKSYTSPGTEIYRQWDGNGYWIGSVAIACS
jgi:hypothetical protein